MGQKIHPIGFRLGITKEHKSLWYADSKQYPQLLQEDLKIRQYIENYKSNPKDQNAKTLGQTAGISNIKIERKADQVDLSIMTARPGIVVGPGGKGINELRTGLQKALGQGRIIRLNVIEVSKPDADASLIAEFIIEQLERRVSFRRVVRQAIQRTQKAEVKGIKIQISGRLNGAEIARSEWIREGRVPLHTLRADIDYSYKTAQTIYGILGVKVWIFKGEVIPGEEESTPQVPAPRRQPRRQKYEDRSE